MQQARPLYAKYAKYYDLLHVTKNYRSEVRILNKLIEKYKTSEGNHLLDVGCGTGRHIQYFQHSFNCMGIDLHENMLEIARKKVSKASFVQGEMASFNLPQKFDVITCLYSTISYSLTVPGLQKTLDNFTRHLKPGGVVIVEPYLDKNQFIPGEPKLFSQEFGHMKMARVSLAKRKEDLAYRKTIISIVEQDIDVFSFTEERSIALFDKQNVFSAMENAGLESVCLDSGITPDYRLFIGVSNVD